MTVYSFDLLVGFEPTGVDKAQALRSRLLTKANIESKFFFSRLVDYGTIKYYHSLGIPLNDMVVAPFLLAGITNIEPQISIDGLADLLHISKDDIYYEEGIYKYHDGRTDYHFFVDGDLNNSVYKVNTFFDGMILKSDYYTDRKIYTEYFNLSSEVAWPVLVRRSYYNQQMEVALDEIFIDHQHYYQMEEHIFEYEQEVLRKAIACLQLSSDDLIIMDRTTTFPFAQILLEDYPEVPKSAFLHSDHAWGKGNTLYYEYYYLFKYLESFSFLIVSTEAQKKALHSYILDNGLYDIPIEVISAGTVSTVKKEFHERKDYSLVIAARLDSVKAIDIAIKSVVLAKHQLPLLTLDIYGQGILFEELQQLIIDQKAEDFIKLRGYQDVTKVYPHYQAYLSTSYSETFGLSLLEALSFGVGLIGFDNNYGNKTFIHHGLNGVMLPFEGDAAEALAEGIVEFYGLQMNEVEEKAYQTAEPYKEDNVARKWKALIEKWCYKKRGEEWSHEFV